MLMLYDATKDSARPRPTCEFDYHIKCKLAACATECFLVNNVSWVAIWRFAKSSRFDYIRISIVPMQIHSLALGLAMARKVSRG